MRRVTALAVALLLAAGTAAADPPATDRDWTLAELRQLLARDLLDAEARRLEAEGKLTTAAARADAVAAIEKAVRPDTAEHAAALLRVAEVRMKLNDTAAADAARRAALDVDARRLGPDHPDVADLRKTVAVEARLATTTDAEKLRVAFAVGTLAGLGGMIERKQLGEAVKAYEAAAATFRDIFGEAHEVYGAALLVGGVVYAHAERPDDAARALRTGVRLLGDLGIVRDVLGQITDGFDAVAFQYATRGNWAEARRARADTLAVLARRHPPDHPRVVTARLALDFATAVETLPPDRRADAATAEKLVGEAFAARATDPATALARARRAHALFGAALGAESLAAADALNLAGLILEDQKDYAAAADCFRPAVAASDRHRGAKHPDAVVRQDNLTRVLYARAGAALAAGDPAAARGPLADIVAVRTALHGKAGWQTVRAAAHLAQAERLAALAPDARAKAVAALKAVENAGRLTATQPLLAARPALVAAEADMREHLGPTAVGTLGANLVLGRVETVARNFPAAERHLRAAADGWAAVGGKDHPEYGYALQRLGNLPRARGDNPAAEALYREAYRVCRTALGPTDAQTLDAASSLAGALVPLGRFVEAEALYREVADQYKAAVGTGHWQYHYAVRSHAAVVRQAGDLPRAAARFRELLSLFEAIGRGKTADHANARNSLGFIELTRGNLDDAERHLTAARDALAALPPAEAGDLPALVAHNLIVLRVRQGNEAEARALLAAHVAAREAAFGADTPAPADALTQIVVGLYSEGGADMITAGSRLALDLAEPLARRALAIHEKAGGPDGLPAAAGLHELGVIHRLRGNYAAAADHFARALAVREQALGPNHALALNSANSLAVAWINMGDLARAEPVMRRTLAATRANPALAGQLALGLVNLGNVYQELGDAARAEPLLREGLEVTQKALGSGHARTAGAFRLLAETYRRAGDAERAELFALRAVAGYRAAKGERSADYAQALVSLARLHLDAGRFDAALDAGTGAVAAADASAAAGQVLVDARLVTARARLGLGQLDEAATAIAEVRARAREQYAEAHPVTATVLAVAAELADRRGDPAGAAALLAEALANAATQLDLGAAGQSERQQIAAAAALRGLLDRYLAAAARAGTPADAVYVHVLRWKGATFARQQRQRAARQAGSPEARAAAERLQALARELATLVNAVPPAAERAAWRARLQELTDEKERLEQELARLGAAGAAAAARVTPTDLRAALPKDAAVVDFIEYRAATPPAGGGPVPAEQRLAAFVVRPAGAVVRVELGRAAPVADAVERWRGGAGRNLGGGVAGPAADLRAAVWLPLAPHLAGADTLVVSPDGAVTRLPFAALPGTAPGSYLLEERAVAVVPVPQLLPALLADRPPSDRAPTLFALGDVDFDLDLATPAGGAARTAVSRGKGADWGRLPGTKDESDQIARAFRVHFPAGKADVLAVGEATEAAVRERAPKARWVHLATHGFFAPPTAGAATAAGEAAFGAGGVGGFHPGLLSGLVLAGANRPPRPDRDDGVITALEVAELDLSGCELAVLSACETGLGVAAGGEGVLGLQRAFQAAGARATVTSLWKVPDRATQALMSRFYANLWDRKMGRLAALREAQLWLLRAGAADPDILRGATADIEVVAPAAGGRAPPYFWAAFTLSGDWR